MERIIDRANLQQYHTGAIKPLKQSVATLTDRTAAQEAAAASLDSRQAETERHLADYNRVTDAEIDAIAARRSNANSTQTLQYDLDDDDELYTDEEEQMPEPDIPEDEEEEEPYSDEDVEP